MNANVIQNSIGSSSITAQLPFDFHVKQDFFILCIKDISIRDIYFHEKAESTLKLSLEKSCIGTGRVIN